VGWSPLSIGAVAGGNTIPEGLRAESLVASEPQLPIDLLSLGGLGRMVLHWEERSRYCPVCGAPLRRCAVDWGKTCAACQTRLFPHVAPCAIVLVRRPGEVLLIRSPNMPRIAMAWSLVSSSSASAWKRPPGGKWRRKPGCG